MSERILQRTTGLCARCKRSLPAEVVNVDGQVVLRKACPDHGTQEAVICTNTDWYLRTLALGAELSPPASAHAPQAGCPFDCGPCAQHQQAPLLPIVPITSACNLDCPICYTRNRNEGPWHMAEEELRAVLRHIREADPARRMVNLTGGEPTQHPRFMRLLELCKEEGLHRITLSTHGLRFLQEEELLDRLAELEARVILSFDSLEEGANESMLGGRLLEAKLRILELLDRHGVNTTLLPVLAKGHNAHEVGALVEAGLSRACVRSIELHTMTFTGQGGSRFAREARLDPFEALALLEAQTGGRLRVTDFVPHPGAHPLCYQVTYLLALPDGRWLPFLRFMEPATLRRLLTRGLYLEPGPEVEETLKDVVQRLWAGEIPCEEADLVLHTLRELMDQLFAPDLDDRARLALAEARTKAVYLHAHMDEETFDTDRIRACPVSIREADGRTVPSCSYNVLYRERDARFMAHPAGPVAALGPGRFWET